MVVNRPSNPEINNLRQEIESIRTLTAQLLLQNQLLETRLSSWAMPVGTIIPYGGDVKNNTLRQKLKDQGWLVCDSGVYKVTEYKRIT